MKQIKDFGPVYEVWRLPIYQLLSKGLIVGISYHSAFLIDFIIGKRIIIIRWLKDEIGMSKTD